jgi:hypothetical protein
MSIDNSHDGASNGAGGQFMFSAQQILDRQTTERAARAKAAADPRSLTEEDVRALPGEVTSALMARGELAHLGLGRRRTGRKH